MSRRPRGLTPGERALWEAHARRYRPLGAQPPAAASPDPPPPPVKAPPPAPAPPAPKAVVPIPPFRVGERARAMGSAAKPSAAPAAPPAPIPADRRARRALARGRLSPEARLDLHGMTLDRAHPALLRFVARAHTEGLRLVLVITGKGRAGEEDLDPVARPRGVLRRQVPDWLSQPPLSGIVQGMAPAHRRHGGEGALYVRLRRR